MKIGIKIGRAEFWTVFFTGALAVAAFYALFYARGQIQEAHEEAQVQHLLVLEQQYEQEPLVIYRKRLAEKRLKKEEEPDELYKVLDFFETVGGLINRGYLDESDVWDNFAYPVLVLNADAGDIIRDYQKQDPAAYERFTSLVAKLEQIESEHHGKLAHLSKNDATVTTFYREELSAGTGVPITLRGHPPTRSGKQ